MIRKLTMRGNRMTIDWDQEDYDKFFVVGLQQIADEHFHGKRQVVVLPVDGLKIDKPVKTVHFSDEFADLCVEYGVNHILREHIASGEGREV